jgi:hypothetical protein
MCELFQKAVAEAKYAYKNEDPSQEEFLATFKNFFLDYRAVSREGSDLSIDSALNRAAVVWADDIEGER